MLYKVPRYVLDGIDVISAMAIGKVGYPSFPNSLSRWKKIQKKGCSIAGTFIKKLLR